MPDIRLPLTASAAEIADAIRQVQARCRLGLCQDPDALAAEVRTQLDAGERAATALGVGFADLRPSFHGWEHGSATVVAVDDSGIEIYRGSGPSGSWRCELTLHVYFANERPRW
jgi:hypothetical protein